MFVHVIHAVRMTRIRFFIMYNDDDSSRNQNSKNIMDSVSLWCVVVVVVPYGNVFM